MLIPSNIGSPKFTNTLYTPWWVVWWPAEAVMPACCVVIGEMTACDNRCWCILLWKALRHAEKAFARAVMATHKECVYLSSKKSISSKFNFLFVIFLYHGIFNFCHFKMKKLQRIAFYALFISSKLRISAFFQTKCSISLPFLTRFDYFIFRFTL